jgi:ferredoxin
MPEPNEMVETALNAADVFVYQGIPLPCVTRDGRARAAALSRSDCREVQPTSIVSYSSRGSVLIIGPSRAALAASKALAGQLACVLVCSDKVPAGVDALRAPLSSLTGYLGQFTATVTIRDEAVDLAQVLGRKTATFDLVLDLGTPPLLTSELPPPGYYAPGEDAQALARALAELPEMVGEFDKPKYFSYRPDICAHGRSGLTGCTRCLDACPAGAIKSLKELIEVDPYRCQGGGSCATACPTGAITYAYPAASDLLEDVRLTLKSYFEAGGQQPGLLFVDREAGQAQLARIGAQLPEAMLPVQVEELGAVGLDVWLSTLAFGASDVALLTTAELPPSVARELAHQLRVAHALLAGVGYEPERVRLLKPESDERITAALAGRPAPATLPRASFVTHDEKRNTLRMAIDHLYAHARLPAELAPLPAGAPFGEIVVDRERCTLCMACTSVCPASAVMAGGDRPLLKFIEWNCVQCGLCEVACPEDAITLNPRIVYAPDARHRTRILNEERPFCCVACGKPFATRSMMDKMTAKLKGHRMFQDPQALRRIQMCEDCRVRDLFSGGAPPPDVRNKPAA